MIHQTRSTAQAAHLNTPTAGTTRRVSALQECQTQIVLTWLREHESPVYLTDSVYYWLKQDGLTRTEVQRALDILHERGEVVLEPTSDGVRVRLMQGK